MSEDNNDVQVKDVTYKLDEVLGMFSKALKLDETLVLDGESNGRTELQKLLSSAVEDRFKTVEDNTFGKAYKKAKKEAQDEVANHFEVSNKGKLDDVLSRIELPSGEDTASQKELTLSEVLATDNPVSRKIKELKKLKTDWKQQYDDLKLEYANKEHFSKVESKAMQVLESLNPVYGGNKERLMKFFKTELMQSKYKFDGDTIQILDAEGNPMLSENGIDHMKFENHIRSLSPFEFSEQQQQVTKPNPITHPSTSTTPNNFGYSKEQIKELSYNDYNKAKQSGDLAKAEFVAKALKDKYSSK